MNWHFVCNLPRLGSMKFHSTYYVHSTAVIIKGPTSSPTAMNRNANSIRKNSSKQTPPTNNWNRKHMFQWNFEWAIAHLPRFVSLTSGVAWARLPLVINRFMGHFGMEIDIATMTVIKRVFIGPNFPSINSFSSSIFVVRVQPALKLSPCP